MLLEIIIVSYNTKRLLKNCLASLLKNLKKENLLITSRVTVVDNASSDGSLEMVRKNFPAVRIIANKKNLGFAKANNQAIKKSASQYIFLLNSDTEVRPDAISSMLIEIKKNDKIWAVGPKLLNTDGSFQQSFGFTPTFLKVFSWMLFLDDLPVISDLVRPYHAVRYNWYRSPQQVGWVSGAALLFKRKIIKITGFLDEKIFMYGEEVEWCYRIRRAGGEIIFLPQAQIIHLGRGSQQGPGSSIIREYQSIIYFYRKYYPVLGFPVRLLLKIGALLRLVLFGIIGQDSSKRSLYVEAFKVA